MDPYSEKPLRVCIIDDSTPDAELVEALLEAQAGASVTTERLRDLPPTADPIEELNPDLVLLDLNLPASRGLQTVERFREICPQMPLIVLTGLEDEAMVQQALRLGAQDFFQKDTLAGLPLLRLMHFAIERSDFQRQIQRYNASLREREQRLETILESTSDGIMALGDNNIVNFANSPSLRLLGKGREDIVGKPLFLPGLAENSRIELEVPRAGESPRYVEIQSSNACWQNKNYWLIVLRDITERKLMLDRVIENERQDIVDQLAAAIAHEFNNSLAIVRMTAELLLAREIEREEELEHLKAMLGEVKRSLGLVSQLTSLSRQAELEIGPIDLVEFLKSNHVIYAKTLGHNVRFKIEHRDPHPVIRADQSLLQQALVNLLVNAGHAMPEGGELTIRTRPADPLPGMHAPQGYLTLEISDTGTGMTPEVRKRIFEPFFTTKPMGKGTGLGLAMVRNVMRRHQGWVDCRSAPGEGTTFWLSFPRSTETPEGSSGRIGSRSAWPSFPAGEIAVVDDNELLCSLLSDLLRVRGHNVKTWSNPTHFIHEIEQGYAPEVVITDLVMPEIGGMELVERVRKRLPQCRYIVISGYNLDSRMRTCGPDSFVQFLQKPFDNEHLDSLLKGALEARRAAKP